MALVCESTPTPSSEPTVAQEAEETKDEQQQQQNDDLEDGEIEDDGDDDVPVEQPKTEAPTKDNEEKKEKSDKNDKSRHERGERRRHEEKKRHMTEAEKSILHLRKRERMQREKWEKYRKEQQVFESPVDDFAINIEKAIASVLKKDKTHSEDEKEEEKRGRKRKNRDKDRVKNKQRRTDSPKSEENENEKSPKNDDKKDRSVSPPRSDDSYESEYSSDKSRSDDRRERKRDYKKKGRNRDRKRKKSRERERRNEQQFNNKDAQGVCVFFLQGKCQKNDCPYSHEAVPPMKLELCKFYLKDCCAKGEKCSYMHSEFPCKFYHTGLVCLQGDNCKFAHGRPLDDHRKQILFKHIETAPREILGGFPRMSREEALNKINLAQQNLMVQYGVEKKDDKMPNIFDINVPVPAEISGDGNAAKPKTEKHRNRPSRWQDPDPIQPFAAYQDQDMRVNSNGDIDMRTLPPLTQIAPPPAVVVPAVDEIAQEEPNFTQDIDIRNPNMLQFDTKDVDIRNQLLATKDVDIRVMPRAFEDDESKLKIDTGDAGESSSLPIDLPPTQRDLYLRIQSQQKSNIPDQSQHEPLEIDDNINWYSDDDDEDENRLTIKVDNEEENKKEEETIMSPTQIKPQEVVEKLGDLSKIDISAEVTKLLTSISQQKETVKPVIRDPRQLRQAAPSSQQKSNEPKISIYEQGSIEGELRSPDDAVEGDFRSRPDVDLRNLQLPFKGMLNYTPAKEIDASVNSHPPMVWKVEIVDIPRPDYTGLKLNIQDAEKTGDPRLKKIFRLSTEEKDSPASPKASPKQSTRIDPRLKKIEETKQQDAASLTYNQQLNLLQSSAFFQSLTSNQKLLLNQELASRSDQNGINDPVLSSMLSTLNLLPNNMGNAPSLGANPNMGAALTILANVNKLNPAMNPPGQSMVLRQNPNLINQMAQSIVQPGLLGAAPGIPNLPQDFPMNFDPRSGGNMINNPPGNFGNFPPDNNFGGVNNFDDYYPPQDNFNNRDNRNFNRDRRRGRNNFNRNNGNRNFRNRNRNRSHTPP